MAIEDVVAPARQQGKMTEEEVCAVHCTSFSVVCKPLTTRVGGKSDGQTLAQARVHAVADIVSELVQGVLSGRDVDLNEIKKQVRD